MTYNLPNRSSWTWQRSASLLLPAILLGACASLEKAPAPESTAGPPPEVEPAYPDLELTPELMYEVLVGEVASQRNQFGVSADALAQAAESTRDPRLLEAAIRAALRAQRPVVALETARTWAATVPKNRRAHEILATLEAREGRVDASLAGFLAALSLYPQEERADAYLHFANLLSRVEKAPSLAVMQSLSNQAPDQATAWLALSRLAMRHQEPERALEAVQQALRLRPNWDEAALLNLRILMTLKRDAEARRFATEFLDRSPRDKRVRLAFGRYLLDQQDKSGARAQFKAVVRYYPTEGNAAFAAGLLAVEANDLKEADYYLKKALEIAPDNDQARLYLGQVASQREHYEEALQWYREVDDPDHAFDAALRIGLVYAESGAVDRARAHLAGLKPVDDRERVRLALAQERVLREVRAWDEAMQVLNAALDTVPDNTDLLYARALLAAQIRDLQLHEKDIRRVLAKEPRNAHALNALGYTLADQGQRLDEALSLVQAALELRPEDPFVLDSMGWVQFRLGNKTLAEQYLRRAFGKRPDADIAAHLGEVLWSTGAQDEARKIWQRALTDAPKSDVLNETIRRLDK